LSLSEPRDVAWFLAACAVSCLVNSSLAAAVLWLTGTIAVAAVPFTWATWWSGDLLGVLLFVPILLTLIGQPRWAWASRRLSVGLTLAMVTLLLVLGIVQVAHWNNERARATFERDASSASLALAAQLREPLHALEALHGVFIASGDVTRDEMRLAAHAWVASGVLRAAGWSERLHRNDMASFEARAHAEGLPLYAVFDRSDGPTASASGEVMAIRYIEPPQGNAMALGLNQLSIPAASTAIEAARQSGAPVATEGFRLTQDRTSSARIGIVVYQAVYAQPTAPEPARRVAATRGVLFVTLDMDAQLEELLPKIPTYLALCAVDVQPGKPARRLAGAPGCESRTHALEQTRRLHYASRDWELRASANPAAVPGAHGADVWLFALVGLMSTAMLGSLLLAVTGRTQRVESAVRERTQALQAEVHERGLAETALRESEQRLRNILNNVPIGVVYTDLAGAVQQTNPRFCELVGYSEAELQALHPANYVHADDLSQDGELMAHLLRGDIPRYRHHKRYLTRHGNTVWAQATVSLLRDAKGRPRHVVAVVEDVTEHLKLQEAEHAREAAEASNRAKSEFLSRMSHELRTPLNAMLGFAQLLELDPRHPLTPTQQPWVGQIQQAGWHLLEMINDVLDLSRIDSGNLRLHTEVLDPADLIVAGLAMIEGPAQARRIELTQELAAGTGRIVGDATRVKQILINLLSNAVKYNVEAGRVHITTRTVGPDRVEIAVTDTGLGMTEAQLGELFQPFNRLGRERSVQEGTGIGLVISQRLAELMGGSLRARSIAGQGSSFILSLPLAIEPDTVRSGLDELAPASAGYRHRRVHYVEDNETNVEVMRGILAQRPQVELDVSITGLDGLAAIRARRHDLILLDMHLPDISGMELLRRMNADPRLADIPVVMVSADALVGQIDAALEAGCVH
ncbi:MAG: CHASE domain-containing protein, partial [Burkholderiaceae bacterium]